MRAKIKIEGPFFGPDFVRGWGENQKGYTIVNSTTAILTFQGGFDPSVTYVQKLKGTGFGVDSQGRLTGTVTSFVGINTSMADTKWTFTNIKAPLNIMNTQAMSLDFAELLVTPQAYDFVGDKYDDFYIMSSFGDIARGHRGDDTFYALSGNDKLLGGAGDDELWGDQGEDDLRGGNGDDLLRGGIGEDQILGMRGDDTILGGGDADTIRGGAGNDTISGEGGGDVINGGRGQDMIDGGADSDVIKGGRGRDTLDGGLDEDTVRGGAGDDIITAGPVDDNAGDRMYGQAGNDTITGYKGVDVLKGGRGADFLDGGDNLDKLSGGRGNDVIAGGTGSDTIRGGAGDDRLSGNQMNAVVLDDGLNKFIFAGRFGNDTITDFHIKFDTIVLLGITEDDVTVKNKGDDVKIKVDHLGHHSILVEGVGSDFDANVDIFYA